MEKYDAYKDSGIEWIGEIPSHWEKARLANRGEFFKGKGVSKAELTKEGLPVVLYGDIYTKYNIKTENLERRIPEEVAMKSFNIEKGDLLFTASGETQEDIGKCVCYVGDVTAYAGGDVIVYRQNVSNSLFLSYLFNSYKVNEQKAKLSKGQIVVHIYSGQLRDINFPLPPIQEQTAIAAYLDRKTAEIDELIADKKRLLELYEEEKTALINQAVTKGINPDVPMKDSGIEWLGEIPEHWEVKKMKHVLESVIGGGTPSTSNPLYWDGEIPWVSAKDMKQDIILSSQDFITEKGVSESSTSYFEDNRIVIVVRSGILKHTFPVAINKVPISINQDLKALQPKYFIGIEFLFWKLKGHSGDILTYCSKMGATVDSIDMAYLMIFPFTFPSDIEEQQSIVHHIETETAIINNKSSNTKKLINLLTEYRTALISEVVTGKIKVVD